MIFFTGDDLLITLFDKLHLNKNTRKSIFQLWEKIKHWYFVVVVVLIASLSPIVGETMLERAPKEVLMALQAM